MTGRKIAQQRNAGPFIFFPEIVVFFQAVNA